MVCFLMMGKILAAKERRTSYEAPVGQLHCRQKAGVETDGHPKCRVANDCHFSVT